MSFYGELDAILAARDAGAPITPAEQDLIEIATISGVEVDPPGWGELP